ncbi:MAG TPA: hypothetical protein VH682_10825 [Gemmataceae bacterium]|jgi:cytochrome c-type biogenesis protein CcmH/NrfG
MDPISTPTTPPDPPREERPSGFSVRRLWQVPVFFLGVVAVLAVFLMRGIVQPDPVRSLHHDLAETRRLLHRHSGDPEAALARAQHVVDNLMYDQGRAAEAFFLLGSAHIRVAETGSATDAAAHWREARQFLQEAERRGLPGDDAAHLQYRLAKVAFYTNDDPTHVVAQLKANKDQADDRAEALALLSQAYLRLNPPDLKSALEANNKLRTEVPQIGEDVLGPAKLAGAKLLFRLNQKDEARKALEKINEQSPPAVRVEGHMLLAGLYQEERKWSEAAELWRAVLAEKSVPLTEPGGVLYNLGVCCRQLDQANQAAEAWSECLQRCQGEEAQAAALALAELRLREAHPEKALEMLTQAVAKVRKADDWKSSLLELPHVQELFEQAITKYRETHHFDWAVQVAGLYERVAVPPQAQVRRAELNTEWAHSTQKHAQSTKDAVARKKDESTADELFRQAAEAHAEAARFVAKKADKDEHEWLGAVCSFDGHDFPRAAEKLTKIVGREKENVDRQSEGWFLLGEASRNLNDLKSAREAYRKCVECGARLTCRARYQLAMLDIDAGKIDEATQELVQNVKFLDHRDADPEAEEKSRFALCSLLYQSAAKLPTNYRKVVQNLEGHINHLSVTPEAVRARFQLADCYRQLTAQSTVNRYSLGKWNPDAHDHYLDVNRRNLTRAVEEFGKLEELIQDAALAALLTNKQRLEVPFIVAQCRFNLGEYEKALQKYDELAKKWGNTPEALFALSGTVQCYGGMRDYEHLRQRAEQIRDMLPKTTGLPEADRRKWQDWLTQISAPPPPHEHDTGRKQQSPTSNDRGPQLNPELP